MRRSCRICTSFSLINLFFLVMGLVPVNALPEQILNDTYLKELQNTARQQKLSAAPYWHILLHYQKHVCGVKSQIDDPAFFLAPDGKTNPEAELQATLGAFFTKRDNDAEASAICRFPARFAWLKDSLNIDPARLPLAECDSFERFMSAVKPESATLIFPMTHLNSPASMFGHTLLTIETANKSKLLAYAVSYSAFTNETFGPLFALRGLTGYYPGYFSILPYYTKLQEYNDMDRRDIWEYQLNLSKPEIRRMMLHIRELDHIASDYYFFDENCSYALFYLLEAARPHAHLTDQSPAWLIPLDSIRIIEQQGFITSTAYRPSRTTKIKHLAARLSGQGQVKALAMAQGAFNPNDPWAGLQFTPPEQIIICDLAGEYLQYLYAQGDVPKKVYQERFFKILSMRSQLGVAKDNPADQIPVPPPPDKGHHSNRLGLGAGMKADDYFAEVRFRAAYHGLMDSDDGYVPGAQLIFADLAVRYQPEQRKVELEGLDLIDIISLSARDRFFHPISWKFKTGFTRVTMEDGQDHLVYEINPGAGVCYGNAAGALAYVLFETGVNAGGAYAHNYALGAGGSAGILISPLAHWKVHAFTRDIYYALGDSYNFFEAGLQQSLTLGADQSFTLDISRSKTRAYYETQIKLAWNYFF